MLFFALPYSLHKVSNIVMKSPCKSVCYALIGFFVSFYQKPHDLEGTYWLATGVKMARGLLTVVLTTRNRLRKFV